MMRWFLFVFLPVGLLSFLFVVVVKAQNVAMSSSTGIAIGAMGRRRGGLIFQRSRDAQQQQEDLPNGISSFEDVSIDIENDSLVFALSTVSRRVCSFLISEDSLKFVNCVGNNNDDFRVSPFCGISAFGGTIMISGGTGGLTIYEYDTDSGEINESPGVLNLDLGVIGHPDVVLVDANLAALSTDFSGSPRFGTQMASIGGDNSVSFVRNFRVQDSLGFSSSLGPANFPLVNAVYTTTSDEDNNSYMYTANGAIQVQDPRSANSITTLSLSGAPDGFSAVTVAVNTEQKYVLFGGLIGGGNSAILIYDIFDDPRNPILMESILLSGQRITSIASAGDAISYTTTQGNDSDGIQFERLPIRDIDDNSSSGITIPPNLCFSGENTVQTFDRGVISMRSLRIGDLVLVEGGKYARVYSFGHYDDKIIINNYLQIISTTNNNKGDSDTTTSILELSADHMVYILRDDDDSNKNIITIPASSIQVGDVLIDGNDAKVVVTKIVNKVNNRRGAYAPFTTTGNIVVSNILASNYISISSMLEENHQYFYPQQQQQWIAHTFNTPHRILCYCSIELFCKNETYNTHGLSNWLVLPYTLVRWLAKQTTVIKCLTIVILVLPLLLFMSFLDKLFMMIASSSMSVFVVFIIGISLLLQRNNKQTTKLNNNNNMKFKIW